ncbi:MAG: hypothetical protein C4536_00895 [Actinobacteria bacterium]|jgi:hypothetical protein|nr:MAG: hypothetical protein C4536_00895 [Actinomycetota bacterium]
MGAGKTLKVWCLSGSYAILKKLKKIGAPLATDAEFLHTPTQDFDWNESFYFNFTDPKREVGGWTRIGILPNQDTDMGAMMLYAGGSRILAVLQTGRAVFEGSELRFGELSYHRLEPLAKWRLVFQGEMMDVDNARKLPELKPETLTTQRVEVDLEVEGMAPCFNFKDSNPRALAEMVVRERTRLSDLRKVSKVSSEHYEQVMRVSGTIKIGNREISFQGSGHRDHSWGVRDWAAPRLWTWLTCQFGEELAFNLSRVAIASVDIFNGFVCREGVNYPLRRAALETEFEEDGVTQKRLAFRIEDVGGGSYDVAGKALTVIPLHLESGGHRTLVNEALAEYQWGDRTGYGIAEYLHQLE